MSLDREKYAEMARTQKAIVLIASLMSLLYIVSDINTYRSFNLSAAQAISDCFLYRCIPVASFLCYYAIVTFLRKDQTYILAPLLAFICIYVIHWSIIGCLTKLPDIQYSREGFIVILITLAFIGYTTSPKFFIPGLSIYFINCFGAFFTVRSATGKLVPLDQYIVTGFPLYLGFILALVELHRSWVEKWQLYKETERLAYIDQLTGAYNRNYMHQFLLDENTFFVMNGAILMVDIDNFKKINDSLGHLEGDHKLKQLVSTIQKNIRHTDYVVRYGGEEFMVIFTDCDEEHAFDIANKILIDTNFLGFSFSGGLKSISSECDLKTNIKSVDSLLYYAKNNGKNQIALASKVQVLFEGQE